MRKILGEENIKEDNERRNKGSSQTMESRAKESKGRWDIGEAYIPQSKTNM